MSEAEAILLRARAREQDRADARRRAGPVDYDALNRMVRRQRAALTRAQHAKNSAGVAAAVLVACRDAVREWNAPGAQWPDDWSRWQRALDDAFPWGQAPLLEDLS